MFGENCAQCGARMSKNDILSGVKSLDVGPRDNAAAAPDTRCGRCHHRYRPTVEVVFSLGREGTEHHKDRVAFFADKVYLVAAVKERDRQGGRKSFAAVTLAEERCRRPLCNLFFFLVVHLHWIDGWHIQAGSVLESGVPLRQPQGWRVQHLPQAELERCLLPPQISLGVPPLAAVDSILLALRPSGHTSAITSEVRSCSKWLLSPRL